MLDAQFAAPHSDTEQTIAAIWQAVLQLGQIGRYDNFFDLGGNSLLLVKVHDQLQNDFERTIPIVQLFTHTTISDLAKHIETRPGAAQESAELTASLARGQQRRARRRKQ
jgi:acyl carrier protein